jgi:PEP-CTERM motif
MSKALFTLALLASALTLPLTAHADPIDDFVITSDHSSTLITFSLPASPTDALPFFIMDGPEFGGFTIEDVSVTVNGHTSQENLTFVGAFAEGSAGLIGAGLYLHSQILYTGLASSPTFRIGSFDDAFDSVNTSGPPMSYTITITPETATTPEPSTLALLTTGIFGLIAVAPRGKTAHHFFN